MSQTKVSHVVSESSNARYVDAEKLSGVAPEQVVD